MIIEEGLTLLSLSFFYAALMNLPLKEYQKKKECSFKEKYFLLFIFCPTASWGILNICSKIFFFKDYIEVCIFYFLFFKNTNLKFYVTYFVVLY